MISAEQFAEWKQHPVTIEVFNEIIKAKKSLEETLSKGQTLSRAADVTHGLTHKAVGQIEGLDQLLNISFAEEKEEAEDISEVSGY